MKDKNLNKEVVAQKVAAVAPVEMEQPLNIEVVERLTEGDKSVLEIVKLKRELALSNAKTALAQSESSELAYNNVVLQLAMRYGLSDGDVINDDGTIQRKPAV